MLADSQWAAIKVRALVERLAMLAARGVKL